MGTIPSATATLCAAGTFWNACLTIANPNHTTANATTSCGTKRSTAGTDLGPARAQLPICFPAGKKSRQPQTIHSKGEGHLIRDLAG
jgi:hypothetical protein